MGRAQAQPGTRPAGDAAPPSAGFVSVRAMFRIELPVVLVVMVAVLFLASWSPLRAVLPTEETYLLLGLITAGTAASASIVAALTGRLLDDRVLLGLGTSLAFYSMVVMPLSVGRLTTGPDWVRAALLGASFSFLVLMALAVFSARRGTWPQSLIAALALAGTAVAGVLGEIFDGVATALLGTPAPAALIFAGWCGLAVVLIVHGASTEQAVTWRVGLGVGVIAVAHLLRAASSVEPVPSVGFFALRLLGLLILLVGLTLYARESASKVRTERAEEYRRLRAAALEAERAAERSAERDHEMRNMIAGISGAARLLDHRPSGVDAAGAAPVPRDDPISQLGAAVRTELDRLRDLLEQPAHQAGERVTPVATLLTRLVMLQRAAGANIELEVARGMRVAMPAAPLTQVITNLLVNCARYAPGAPITVLAGARSGRGWIEVIDAGPGLALSADGTSTGGSGLGLSVSDRLLAAFGGSLRLTQNAHGPGCTATVEIPLATEQPAASGTARGVLMVGTA